MQEKIKEILDQIETVIVGKNEVMERCLLYTSDAADD